VQPHIDVQIGAGFHAKRQREGLRKRKVEAALDNFYYALDQSLMFAV
jgi:hypothetical protein